MKTNAKNINNNHGKKNDTYQINRPIEKVSDFVKGVYSSYSQLQIDRINDNCITGDDDHLLDQLKASIKNATAIDIIVSFLMESGVRLILEDLRSAMARGVEIRILTGSYLNITQPSALYLLKDTLGEDVDLRFYGIENKSFHAKAYIFKYKVGGDIFVGSSNISRSALTSGIEWNYKLNEKDHEKDYNYFGNMFEKLFNNYSKVIDEVELKRYSKSWKKPKVFNNTSEVLEAEDEDNLIEFPRPMGAQIEALYELKKFRNEGFDKGLVVAATGVGKTYLAAFDSKNYSKILFVAHREEILKQAANTFRLVRPELKIGFFSGTIKDKDCDILMASVQTLGRKDYLKETFFRKDEFQYIIIDEFHHAVASNYLNIIDYFTPKFLLGLTATPERLDNKDVFALCDYNIVYEVRLKDAINKGWLVPFRYYGIFDETDYNKIDYSKGKYNENELEEALMINKRAELIFNNYKKYNSKRAIGFCSSRSHAGYMAKYFLENGVNACCVVSGNELENSMNREEAIAKLNKGAMNVIFSVDMFNEGLDVPSIDMVMFLRPTESPTVFLQQLGRGLRKCAGKKYLNILDFIGNYKKANLIPFFLSGDRRNNSYTAGSRVIPCEDDYPDDCIIDFDFRLIDIFKRQAEEMRNIKSIIYEEYIRIKELLEHRPTRLEVFTYIDDDIYLNMKRNSKLNIFNNYIGFLKEINELDSDEQALLGTKAFELVNIIETTSMTKSYKMPLLLGFYNNANFKTNLSKDDIYISFYEFYKIGSNAADILRDKGGSNFKNWTEKDYLKVAKNPEDALINSAGEFFNLCGEVYCITKDIEPFKDNSIFLSNFKDAIDYRTRRFYKERIEER